jgi:regulator of protease activity HflC (stomatin/prohibitin superfamily)
MMGETFPTGRVIAGVVAALIVVVLIVNSFTVVNTGYVGVETQFGAMTGKLYQPGLRFKLPFIVDIVPFYTRNQSYEMNSTDLTRDLQTVQSRVVINYQIDPSDVLALFQHVGPGYADTVVAPNAQSALHVEIGQFTVQDLISTTAQVQNAVQQTLTNRPQILAYRIQVLSVNMTDNTFSPDFVAAVNRKQIAQQDLQRVTLEAQQKVVQANAGAQAASGDATAHVTVAKGNAQATLPEAQANAQAQKEQSVTLSALYNQYTAIQKWSGSVPLYVTGGSGGTSPIPFLSLGGDVAGAPTQAVTTTGGVTQTGR